MKGREYKDAVFENFARVAMAFAAPKRLEIIDILAQSENIAKCQNENNSYNVELMKRYKINPRDIYRNTQIVNVVNEFEFDEVIVEFETLEIEATNIRSLGKNNEVITYKHSNSIKVIFGFELMKVYLETYGEVFETN